MKNTLFLLIFLMSAQTWAGIPATPVMTLYKFNGNLEIPYYGIESFQRRGASSPAGTLSQGTSLIPCLVIRNGKPLTDGKGTPFVGFEIVVDSRKATPASTQRFKQAFAKRRSMTVTNHHCPGSVKHVINVRTMFKLEKAPSFDPPVSGNPRKTGTGREVQSQLDEIVRAFHNSPSCERVNRKLIGRRQALDRAWGRFMSDNQGRWAKDEIARAKHLDYTMRTAIFEGHLDRGCNAYGACERNIIALSIRNRGRSGSCSGRQGCRFPGDYQGVSSKVSQYNIWDEYLTQISGLTSCFLRRDLGNGSGSSSAYYEKIQGMYGQNVGDVARILFGGDRDLGEIFKKASLSDLKELRHYYHAPAMGKCYPKHKRVEYMSGAVARKGGDFALIANTRIRVDEKTKGGYAFREFIVEEEPERDRVQIVDNFPGFVVDARKVSLKGGASCPPYGISPGCRFKKIGRYRKTPPWLKAGKSLALQCQIRDRGEKCRGGEKQKTVTVGGSCDTQMRPVTRVP